MTKETKNTEVENSIKRQNLLEDANTVHALAYIPYFIGAAIAFFLGKTDKKMIMHHVKYSLMLAVGAIILFIILNSFFGSLINIVYIIASGYFAFKAYKGEAVSVEILDTIEEKITEKVHK